MNKSELIDQIAKAAGISKAAAGRSLEATTSEITKALKKGTLVTLIGFGTFYVGKRAARNGRNPRTGATIKIKATNAPKFRASNKLKTVLSDLPPSELGVFYQSSSSDFLHLEYNRPLGGTDSTGPKKPQGKK